MRFGLAKIRRLEALAIINFSADPAGLVYSSLDKFFWQESLEVCMVRGALEKSLIPLCEEGIAAIHGKI